MKTDLPKPKMLRNSLYVDIEFGDEKRRLICVGYASTTVDEPPHFKNDECLLIEGGILPLNETTDQLKIGQFLVPFKYITNISRGPGFALSKPEAELDRLIIGAGADQAQDAMSSNVIHATLKELGDVIS